TNASWSSSSSRGVACGPGLFSLVVVPSGSVIVMFTRRSPACSTGRQSMPAASSSSTNGSSLAAGRTAIDGRSAATQAREMFTPLPPAWEITDSARWTAPRSSGAVSLTVRSRLGLAVRVTIMRLNRSCDDHLDAGLRERPPVRGRHVAVGDQYVDLPGRSEADGRVDAELRGVGERHDLSRTLDQRPLHRGLVGVGRGEAVLRGDAVRAEERDVHAEVGE